MDLTIRKNDHCIVGLPACGNVFNSSKSCFIGYGFDESNLEREILSTLLRERNIEPIDAGTILKPAQNAFCIKICSKILSSQFCIILANNDVKDGQEKPNANVNMEYGLMLGFNKYVIPFQRSQQMLPFNVAPLDTVKYTTQTFRQLAEKALDEAISATTPKEEERNILDITVDTFLASRNYYLSPIDDPGEKMLFNLGSGMNFFLFNHFDGLNYIFFGQFSKQRAEIVIWKIKILTQSIDGRTRSFPKRHSLGIMDDKQLESVTEIFNNIQIWLLVSNEGEREKIQAYLKKYPNLRVTAIFTTKDVREEFDKINKEIENSCK
jgi:hypothetical protein